MQKNIWAQESITAYEISTHLVNATDSKTKTERTMRSIFSNVQSERGKKKKY